MEGAAYRTLEWRGCSPLRASNVCCRALIIARFQSPQHRAVHWFFIASLLFSLRLRRATISPPTSITRKVHPLFDGLYGLGQRAAIKVASIARFSVINTQINLSKTQASKFSSLTPSVSQSFNTNTMSLFRSNKNKSASTASTPAQTPRTSMQEQRPANVQAGKMTRDQALDAIMRQSMSNAAASCFVR